MSNPQLENGYLKIANELIEALSRTNLSGQEFRIILAIIRKTYGFNKKSDYISRSQFTAITGISDPHRISQLTKQLSIKKLLIKNPEKGKTTKFRINKNYSTWKGYNPLKKVNGSTDNPLGKVNGYPLRKLNPPVKKNEPTKDNTTKDSNNIPSNQDLPEAYFDLSLKFHKHQKKNGYYHKDFKSELNYKSPVVKNGAETIDKLIRLDNESLDEIKKTLRFVLIDDFWQNQVISLNGLRRKSKNGNTKYFNIKNKMQSSRKEIKYTLNELAEIDIKPYQLEKYFNSIGDDKYKPTPEGRELIKKVNNGNQT